MSIIRENISQNHKEGLEKILEKIYDYIMNKIYKKIYPIESYKEEKKFTYNRKDYLGLNQKTL